MSDFVSKAALVLLSILLEALQGENESAEYVNIYPQNCYRYFFIFGAPHPPDFYIFLLYGKRTRKYVIKNMKTDILFTAALEKIQAMVHIAFVCICIILYVHLSCSVECPGK